MVNKLAMVVDDSRVARMMLSKLLQNASFAVVEQGSADEAKLWLSSTETLPNIIFMDLLMPGTDGLTATRQIKADARWQSIPVVLCTSNDSEADKLSAQQSGVLALLSKPPQAQQLESVLQSVYSVQAEAEPVKMPVTESIPIENIQSPTQNIETLIAQLEQHFLPILTSQCQEVAQQISLQTCEKSVNQWEDKLAGINTELSQSLQQEIVSSVENRVTQQLSTQTAQIQTVLSEKAADAVEAAMQNIAISTHWEQQISSRTEQWLGQQQQSLQDQLTSALKPQISTMISQQLENKPDISAVVNALHQELTQHQLLQKQMIKRQRVTSALLMVALIVSSLALLQINFF